MHGWPDQPRPSHTTPSLPDFCVHRARAGILRPSNYPLLCPSHSCCSLCLTLEPADVVQVYELDTFKVTHASKYPGPVLSLGIAPDCSLLAVGQADGQLSIRKHATPKIVPVEAGTCSAAQPLKTGNANADVSNAAWIVIVSEETGLLYVSDLHT